MAKEQFTIAASKPILDLIERAGQKAGFARGRAFEDFLTFVRCALAGETMEEEYLQTVHKGYEKGQKGKRGIDIMAEACRHLISEMCKVDDDILGDIFTGGITYGESGQFFTPDSVCQLMADLVGGKEAFGAGDGSGPRTINDPACGSGRMLLASAKANPNAEFVGQDVDHRCAQMTAINMGLRGLNGWAVWQNTLTLECNRVYRVGLFFNEASRGVIREVAKEQSPFNYSPVDVAGSHRSGDKGATESCAEQQEDQPNENRSSQAPNQLDLF